jgi:broad specificity phosphatase PhoE
MSTRVLLLRHAESANPLIFHGAESDVGLSERGLRQAEAIAPILAAYRPDHVISSAMRRAVATAEPIARACGKVLHIEPGLHERRVGTLSGTPTGARQGVWPDTLQRWMAGDTSYAPEGAEAYDALQSRLLPLWDQLTSAGRGQTLVIVAHGVVCKVLVLSLQPGKGPADWLRLGPIHNVGITELVQEDEGGWQMVRFNEVPDVVSGLL